MAPRKPKRQLHIVATDQATYAVLQALELKHTIEYRPIEADLILGSVCYKTHETLPEHVKLLVKTKEIAS